MKLSDIVQSIQFNAHKVGDILNCTYNGGDYQLCEKRGGGLVVRAIDILNNKITGLPSNPPEPPYAFYRKNK